MMSMFLIDRHAFDDNRTLEQSLAVVSASKNIRQNSKQCKTF